MVMKRGRKYEVFDAMSDSRGNGGCVLDSSPL